MKEFPPFRLDIANQSLLRRTDSSSDERVRLTPKAFSLLHYLVERAGRLVTQEELLEAVWPGVYVLPQAVKAHILEIRTALGDDARAPVFIETLPKRGYRFIAPIREGSVAAFAAPAKPAHGRLVNRIQTLAELGDCLRKASRGQRQMVFVTGEPGIGKTAVVDELQRQAAIDVPGILSARGQCIEGYGGKEAYYPMLEALAQLCHGSGAAFIVDNLATQAPTWLVQFPALVKREQRETLQQEIMGATRERMLREIGVALETIASETLVLLVFEDLQWVDHSTVDLLSALARRRTPAKLMLIATYRSVDLALSDHPLKALRQDLLVHQLCREIDLEPLAEADVAEFLTSESSQVSPPEGLAQLIHRHTEGNPLFMVAALDHLTQRGLIWQEDGIWQLKVPLDAIDLEVPESLRQMIEAQIERLSVEEQRALEAASVVGAVFSAGVAAAAIDMVPEDFEDLCESLVRRHRIVRSVGAQQFLDGAVFQRYEFVHALYREVLYHRQAPRRRATLHRRIGECIEALFSQQLIEVAPELAHHFEQAFDWQRTVKYLRLAANAAVRRYASREAAALLRQALTFMSKIPETERATDEIGILETLAPIYLVSYDMRALETYEALAARAAHYGMLDLEVRALIDTAYFLSRTNSQRCLEVLDRALRLSAEQVDPLARARSRMQCSHWRIWAGGWNNEDAAACRNAVSEIRQAGNLLVLAPHLIDYSNLLFMCSEYRESHQSALESLAVLTEGGKGNISASFLQVRAAYITYCDLLFLGEWGEALREIEAVNSALAKNANNHPAQGQRLWHAWLHVHAMDFGGALAICESAARSLGDAVAPAVQRFYLVMVGTAEGALGNHKRALEHLSQASHEMDRQMVMNDWYCRMPLELALTELWLTTGDVAQARAQAARFLEVTLATAERTYQALAWEANARVAMGENDLKRAQECIAKAVSTMEGFEVPLAHWRVHATAAKVCGQTGEHEASQRHRAFSRDTILKLANSLTLDDPLRATFLGSQPVVEVLAAD